MTLDIQKINQFKKTLGIKNNLVAVSFRQKLPKISKNPKTKDYYQDVICTAIKRVSQPQRGPLRGRNVCLAFGNQESGLPSRCAGANYFLHLGSRNKKETIKTYVNKEHCFASTKIANKFLTALPSFPKNLFNQYIILQPLEKINTKPQVILMIVTPAQVNRLVGLYTYHCYQTSTIYPAIPTCVAVYLPLVTGQPHINFIDYYDRFYQGKQKGASIWNNYELIFSLTIKDFQLMLKNLKQSPFGSFKVTKVRPHPFDYVN